MTVQLRKPRGPLTWLAARSWRFWVAATLLPLVLYVASMGPALAAHRVSGSPAMGWLYFRVYDPLISAFASTYYSAYVPRWLDDAIASYLQAWIDGLEAVSPVGPVLAGTILTAVAILALARRINQRPVLLSFWCTVAAMCLSALFVVGLGSYLRYGR